MGCCSAEDARHASYRGSSGTAIEYLLNGSSALVRTLWGVPGEFINRLTETFVKHWLSVISAGNATTCNLAESLAIDREARGFPNLVGAATVACGLLFL